MVSKIDPSQREAYLELAPDTFFLTDHYRTSPIILVDLATLRPEVLRELIEKAWRFVASARQVKTYGLT